MVVAVVRFHIDRPMPNEAVKAYIGSQLCSTALRADSIEIEFPGGPSSDKVTLTKASLTEQADADDPAIHFYEPLKVAFGKPSSDEPLYADRDEC